MIACPVCDGTILTAASVPREPGLVRCAACSLVFRPGADDDPVRAALSDSERRLEERVAERRAKHFEALVWGSLGLDRHPELRDAYFGNYRRIVLLSQTDDPAVEAAGREAAEMLGLEFEHVHVGRDRFAGAVSVSVQRRVA